MSKRILWYAAAVVSVVSTAAFSFVDASSGAARYVARPAAMSVPAVADAVDAPDIVTGPGAVAAGQVAAVPQIPDEVLVHAARTWHLRAVIAVARAREVRRIEARRAAIRRAAIRRAERARAAARDRAEDALEARARYRSAASVPAGLVMPARVTAAGSWQQITADLAGGSAGCLNAIIERESGGRVDATNPVSGAYGIPQALPGGKMASAGADWATNPATQIRWMVGYTNATYGSPCAAWAHEQATGSY